MTGDLIALSDQDDIWYPHRLQRSEQEFVAHPEAGLVFSDADVIDERNRLLGRNAVATSRLRRKATGPICWLAASSLWPSTGL